MAKFRKKPVVVEAEQWFRNGDHSEDASQRMQPSVDECEGLVVRYYRDPKVASAALCTHCHLMFHTHGWIDTLEGGHIVCPGDWIITGIKGERYPCKPDIFEATYEPVDA
ncbi:MAG: hypothetical protein V3W51_04610 [Candidatus Brocadiales bacterium]